MQASGVAVIFIGIAGTLQRMFTVSGGALETQGTMLLIFSLVLGSLLGCLIDVERRMEQAGDGLRKLLRRKNDSGFVDGFVNTTLIICIGAMAIVGSIQDGLTGDHSLLFAKALLDGVSAVVFASSLGIGVAFSRHDTRGLAARLDEVFEQMREDGSMEKLVGKYLDDPAHSLEVDALEQ